MNTIGVVTYRKESLFDPVGRICVMGDRIFRAISCGYEEKVLSFLSSDLFKELRNRNWIVDTWIAEDVKIDNCKLILEHEKLTCICPDVWTFSQWVDAAKFYIELHDYCINNGGTVNDARPSNIVFQNGKPIFIDFGSLIKLDEDIRLNWSRDFYISFLQTISYLSAREYFYAFAWANNAYCYYIDNQILPSKRIEDSLDFYRTYRHVIKSYDVCRRQKQAHIRVRLYSTVAFIKFCNKIARWLFNKKIDWNLFKITALYKAPSLSCIERIGLPYSLSDIRSIHEIHNLSIVRELTTIKSRFHIKRMLMYGNVGLSEMKSVAESTNMEIIVVSPDLVYTDTLYRNIKKCGLNIHVTCANLRLELRQNVLNDIASDIVYIPENNPSFFRMSPVELCAAVQKVSSRVMLPTNLYSQIALQNMGFSTQWQCDNYLILEKCQA